MLLIFNENRDTIFIRTERKKEQTKKFTHGNQAKFSFMFIHIFLSFS